ncbi:hypothetical protein, partial [Flavobacterium psychrophilum]|uniref:hypothetical protein n=1 Tax=Flavobacterium psychrophilum TaxID=96345 RepID=UPI001D06932F
LRCFFRHCCPIYGNNSNGIFILNSCYLGVSVSIATNVPALGEVANFGTDYFLSKIKFLARNKREFTTKFAI